MKPIQKTIIWVSLFAIAMGFMESAVVIYLRELYYPGGFSFPLKSIPASIGKIEFYREFCTLVMLVGIGIVSGQTKLQRFAYFVLAFAVWDLFYYIFLYLFLDWPASLFTWDILFLIPVPWVGPVWAPCLLSFLMIAGAVFVIRQTHRDPLYRVAPFYWWLLITGAFVCIVSFMWDYLAHTGKNSSWNVFSEKDLFTDLETYVPQTFNYVLFLLGFSCMTIPVALSILKTKIKNEDQ